MILAMQPGSSAVTRMSWTALADARSWARYEHVVMKRLVIASLGLLLGALAFAGKKHPAADTPHGKATVVDTPVDLATRDEPRQTAEQYLKAIEGSGDDGGRDLLLGGATMTAKIFTLPNWKIVSREPYRKETGNLADVAAHIDAIDRAGRTALSAVMGGGPLGAGDKEGLGARELSADDATRLLGPTRTLATAFQVSYPVFAYVARVDRAVYWHPKNPIRKLIADAGRKGPYQLDLHLFRVETLEGLGTPTPRVWPLRVLRLKTATFDTGWKILPASDWNAE